MKDRVEKFREWAAHPDVTGDLLAGIYFRWAGEFPEMLAELTGLLPDNARTIVERSLAEAPTDEAGWQDYRVAAAECDSDKLTRGFRLGVEAVRRFHRPQSRRNAT